MAVTDQCPAIDAWPREEIRKCDRRREYRLSEVVGIVEFSSKFREIDLSTIVRSRFADPHGRFESTGTHRRIPELKRDFALRRDVYLNIPRFCKSYVSLCPVLISSYINYS